MPALQELGPVWAPDLPGFGIEPPAPPERRDAEAYAAWVAERLRERRGGPYGVVGYSFGGTVALLLALRHPELVSRLVLCCTSPFWGRGVGGFAAAVLAGPAGLLAAEFFQATVRWSFRRASRRTHLRPEFAFALHDMLARAHRPTMAALCRSLARIDLRGLLSAVRCPTLVVGGTREFLVPPSHHRAAAAALPGAELRLFPGAGHVLCLTRAQEFSTLLADYLSGGAGDSAGGKGRRGNGALG